MYEPVVDPPPETAETFALAKSPVDTVLFWSTCATGTIACTEAAAVGVPTVPASCDMLKEYGESPGTGDEAADFASISVVAAVAAAPLVVRPATAAFICE
jgi:hypothetical protein